MTPITDPVEAIARAVLYEGHMLYPYRRSALKNRQPWSFGTLAPQPWAAGNAEPDHFHSECLVHAEDLGRVEVELRLRFLHLGELSDVAQPPAYGESIDRVVSTGRLHLATLLATASSLNFQLPEQQGEKPSCRWQPISGSLSVSADLLMPGVLKLTIEAANRTMLAETASRDEALFRSLVAAHLALSISGGEFVSLLEPPEEFTVPAADCRNVGVYPVLVGRPGDRTQMLASPIILYDYPQIAPESPGDFFDATEMDEMLSLRILTLTEEEKQQVRNAGEQARALLERTETLPPEQLLKVHGVIRGMRPLPGDDEEGL
jgi:hypothetical protein